MVMRSVRARARRLPLTVLVAALAAMSLLEGTASAQVRGGPTSASPDSAPLAVRDAPAGMVRRLAPRTVQPIRDSVSRIDFDTVPGQRGTGASVQTVAGGRRRSVTRKVLGAAIGATGGFFAGGYLGASIEGNRCNCDDPGLKGALIGAPVGAAVGGVLGAMFF